jgi:hypothetical protein
MSFHIIHKYHKAKDMDEDEINPATPNLITLGRKVKTARGTPTGTPTGKRVINRSKSSQSPTDNILPPCKSSDSGRNVIKSTRTVPNRSKKTNTPASDTSNDLERKTVRTPNKNETIPSKKNRIRRVVKSNRNISITGSDNETV